MKERIKNFAADLCFVYTIVSVSGALINHAAGTQTNNFNVILMFSTCAIATFVLHLHKFFSELSPLLMMVIQYLVACVLCAVLILILSAFTEPPTLRGWYEFYRSFTIPYVLLAALYYVKVFSDTRKQNNLLQEIQQSQKHE